MPPASRWAACQWFSTEPFPSHQSGLDLVVMESWFGPRQRQSLSITILSAIIVIVAETASFPQYPFFPSSLVIEPPISRWTHGLPK